MTEDIITDLGKISALSVISRRTAFNYKSHTISNAELRDLGVTHTVEGSIRKSGDRIRVTAQLTKMGTDEQLWGERFDRTLDDIFAIQDEISEAIVKALQLTLAPDEKNALERKPTQNTEAYDLYVLARQFSRTGSERMQPIIERLCQRAVELDPLFAEAWAMIAFARAEMHQRNVQEGMADDGRSAAEKAIELNPDLADGHSAMAEVMIRGDTLDFRLAEPYISRAFDLDPDSYTALMQSGYIGIMTGNFQHAIDVYERACAQDPNAYRAAGMIVQAYKGMGDEEGVERSCLRVVERCERLLAVEPDHGGALGFYITALIQLGEEERAKALATRAEIFHPDNIRMLYNIACGFSEAGDLEPALRLLRRVLDKASRGWIEWMGRDNSLDPIREAPQYKALIAEALTRLDSQ